MLGRCVGYNLYQHLLLLLASGRLVLIPTYRDFCTPVFRLSISTCTDPWSFGTNCFFLFLYLAVFCIVPLNTVCHIPWGGMCALKYTDSLTLWLLRCVKPSLTGGGKLWRENSNTTNCWLITKIDTIVITITGLRRRNKSITGPGISVRRLAFAASIFLGGGPTANY